MSLTAPPPLSSTRLPLRCHPATPCALPLQLSVRLALGRHGTGPCLQLHYQLCGDVARLRLPAPAQPGPADGLWQHTCFEAFVGVQGQSAYREYNFSPSGQWAAYRFHDQRQRDPAPDAPEPPRIELQRGPDSLTLQACLPLAALPPASSGQPWDLGLSAVIETRDGQLSYWALQHPAERPDFHHRGGWQSPTALPAQLSPDL